MNRNRPRVWDITFGDSPGNGMASGSNHNAKGGGDFRRYQQYGYNNEDQDESDIYHPHMVHSIHRNRRYTSQDDIRRTQSARLGGTFGRTLHRRESESSSHNIIEEHADLIVAKMERDPALMEDSPASEDLRREALRDMPQCLKLKRCVKVKLVKSVSKKSKRRPIGCFKRFKYRASFGLSRLRVSFKNLLYSMELWYGALKQIEGNFGSGIGSYFKFLRRIFTLNLFVALVSFVFIVLPQLLCSQENERAEFHEEFKFEHIFTGEGYFRNSLLYYGFYTNRTLSFGSLPYHMPYAYFFTMACIYLSCLAFFSISAARSYSKSFIETEGGLKNVFANKIFCGWDYSIATKDAAQLKCHSIYNELREILSDCMKPKQQRSCLDVFYTKIIQLMVNILVIIALAAAGYVMWFFMKESFNEGWTPIYTAVVVNTIMTVFPIIFSWIVQYEDYRSPSKNLYITLIRTFILGFVTIGVLLGFWLKDPSNPNSVSSECWETSLGVEIYRLILFDFFFSVIIIPILGVIAYAISRYFRKSYLHFDISAHTMQIIYNQSLFWMGLFFSPLLPIIVTIKIFIIWYIRQGFLLKFCKPSTKTWRAAQNSTWFLMMALLGLLLVIGLMGYIISDIRTTDCGPCRHYDYIYEIITLGILNLRTHSTVFRILLFTTKPGFIALVLLALCGRVYYMRAKAHSLRTVVALYREMLVWESRDKEFLLQNLSDISEGKWQYRIQDFRKMDPIVSSPFVSEFETEQRGDTADTGDTVTAMSGPSSYTESDIDVHFSSYKKYP